MGFKENLKSELDYQGMLVKELSLKSGIKKQTLDNYLSTHNSVPNAEIAVKIAKALGTTVEYLITGENSKNSNESSSEEIKNAVISNDTTLWFSTIQFMIKASRCSEHMRQIKYRVKFPTLLCKHISQILTKSLI